MVQFGDLENELTKSEMETDTSVTATWSEEHDCLPLKQRLKLLLATKPLTDFSSDFSGLGWNNGSLVQNQSVTGHTEEDKCIGSDQISTVENTSATERVAPSLLLQPNFPVTVKVKQIDDGELSLAASLTKVEAVVDIDDFLDDLDHVVLIDRRKMLLSRKESRSEPDALQGHFSGLEFGYMDNMIQRTTGKRQCESQSDDKVHLPVGNDFKLIHKSMPLDSANDSVGRVSFATSIPTVGLCCPDKELNCFTNSLKRRGNDLACFSEKVTSHQELGSRQDLLHGGNMISSAISALVSVKAEPLDSKELESMGKESLRNFPVSNLVQVRTKLGSLDHSCTDILDHMFLRERMKLLPSRDSSRLSTFGTSECSVQGVAATLGSQPFSTESAELPKVSRPRKRRKTATDSVETALEEDVPGLLQVLIGKGVAVEEMKLYGQTEIDEALADSSLEDSFTELEAVISKLFSQRDSLLKFPPLRCNKGEKASYCLACLFSLVEQARYLRFRNWPVEWGWCRDLQSFIFVFKRHNRIVLERPEYGYATYFFELVDSLPIDWQVKRLVTAMKLSSCSRVTLIEDRALMIGDDLTEGEARVLMEYGWMPNSGLGTMLNYCNRVVHDRKNEDSSEWRSKIGKLLMDGYNGGTIVPSSIPIKLSEYNVNQSPQIKLELN